MPSMELARGISQRAEGYPSRSWGRPVASLGLGLGLRLCGGISSCSCCLGCWQAALRRVAFVGASLFKGRGGKAQRGAGCGARHTLYVRSAAPEYMVAIFAGSSRARGTALPSAGSFPSVLASGRL